MTLPPKILICAQPADGALASALRAALAAEGLAPFYPADDLEPGDLWDSRIRACIEEAAGVVVLVTPAWSDSEYYASETVAIAIEQSTRTTCLVIPVVIEGTDARHLPLGLKRVVAIKGSREDIPLWAQRIAALFTSSQAPYATEAALSEHAPAPRPDSEGHSFDLLVDNWLLQDMRDLLEHGVDPGEARLWRPDGAETVMAAVLQIEGLARFLASLVMYDSLAVDKGFTRAWSRRTVSPLTPLKADGIIREIEFVETEDLSSLRSMYSQRLCTSVPLRAIQSANESSWASSRNVVDSAASQIIWGGAGYLARAEMLALPYQGHPSRMALMSETVFGAAAERPSASQVFPWIEEQHREIMVHAAGGVTSPPIVLPAIFCKVVRESSTVADLLPVAIQLRAHYAPLRRLLAAYDRALYDGDPLRIKLHRQVLADAKADAHRVLNSCADDSRIVASPRRSVANTSDRAAARTLLQQLILGASGVSHLDELLVRFDVRPPDFRLGLRSALLRRWSDPAL